MSTIAQIEDAMLAALREKLPGVEVDTLPGPPEEAARRTMRMPAVWVVYVSGSYRPNRAMNNYVIQQVERNFYVVIITRNLRSRVEGARGAYDLLELCREALAGLETPDGVLEIAREQLANTEGGLFVYWLVITCKGEYRKKL